MNKIYKIRRYYDLSQSDFSQRIGRSKNYICSIENGKLPITESIVSRICEEFPVSKEWLTSDSNTPFVPISRDEQIEKFVKSIIRDPDCKFQRGIISTLSMLSTDQWKELETFMIDCLRYSQNNDGGDTE